MDKLDDVQTRSTTFIDLIRHGEPAGGRYYRGHRDDPLSDKGWRQMWDAAARQSAWDCIVSSPLRRCSGFAAALGERRGIPVHVDDRFKEVGFGSWEGRSPDEIRRVDPDGLRRFLADPAANRPAGAEPLNDFYHRVIEAWGDVLSRRPGSHPLIVCHAGVIRAVLCRVLEIPLSAMYRIQVPNAGLTRIRVEEQTPPLLVFHGA